MVTATPGSDLLLLPVAPGVAYRQSPSRVFRLDPRGKAMHNRQSKPSSRPKDPLGAVVL